MDSYFQILIFVIMGVALLWFGYTLFIGQFAFRLSGQDKARQRRRPGSTGKSGGAGEPGDPRVCPVCSARLNKGELVKSQAFPSLSGGKDRFMHIQGCAYCLDEGCRPRRCPVCGASLDDNDYLIARMFKRSLRRSHVHVMGCTRCKKL